MPKPSEDGLNRGDRTPKQERNLPANSSPRSASSKDETAGSTTASKPQLLRVATVVKNNGIDSVMAAAVMTANRLRPGNRIEPAKFLKMVESFRQRKIKRSGGGR